MRAKLMPLLLIGMGTVLSGCSLLDKAAEKATEKATEAIIESETNADVDISNGGFTVTDDESGDTVSFGDDIDLPDGFPSDVPIMDGAKIIAASDTSTRGEYTATLMTTNFAKTEAYYEEAIVDEGWTIDDSSTVSLGSSITTITASKGERNLTVGIYQSTEEEVSVILTVTE